jgi:hypothetical protein
MDQQVNLVVQFSAVDDNLDQQMKYKAQDQLAISSMNLVINYDLSITLED